jgi:hypothetical protein
MTKGNKTTRGHTKVVHQKKEGDGDKEDDVEIRKAQCYFH